MEEYLIAEAPPSVHYIPNFISAQEEADILENIYAAPKPKWTYLNNRRLQNWGGLVSSKGLIPDGPLPKWLDDVIDGIVDLPDVFNKCNRPNHVLINEYEPNQGILPHVDGPSFSPTITTVSLQSHTVLDLYQNIHEQQSSQFDLASRYIGSLFLEPRSLLILRNSMYKDYMHGIEETQQDQIQCKHIFNWKQANLKDGDTVQRQTRVSLTIRNVSKVSKLDIMKLIGK